jgi:murein L,D-transpeptidase YafK
MKRAQIALVGIVTVAVCGAFAAGQSVPEQSRGSLQQQQLKFPRVRTAKQEKDAALRAMFVRKGLAYPPRAILLRAFKKEGALELWGAGSEAGPYVLLKTYGICATSGQLGPKRRSGDTQVPEGFYDLDFFNPQSNFYLSMHINYPNAADSILGYRPNLGGTIYLHGNCASIGCIPITDDGIKEVYWLSVLVRDSGAKHLPLQIFPARMSEHGFRELAKTRLGKPELVAFWANLKEGFDAFEKDHKLAAVRVAKDGRYEFIPE